MKIKVNRKGSIEGRLSVGIKKVMDSDGRVEMRVQWKGRVEGRLSMSKKGKDGSWDRDEGGVKENRRGFLCGWRRERIVLRVEIRRKFIIREELRLGKR